VGYKRPLSKSTILNVFANVNTMFADADNAATRSAIRAQGFARHNAQRSRCAETQGAVLTAEQLSLLISDQRIPRDRRTFYALEFLTGARFGEAAGFRWKDYDDPKREPLGHLRLERQYEDLPLKGKRGQPGPARDVPVHVTLAAMLDEWRTEGFPAAHAHHPRPHDFIVPGKDGRCRSHRACAYWIKRDCALMGIDAKEATHVGRRTFITLAIANGAPEAWVKRITHNANGDVLSGYTVNDWPAMCDVVRRIPVERVKLAEVIALPIDREARG
jgi:integrase